MNIKRIYYIYFSMIKNNISFIYCDILENIKFFSIKYNKNKYFYKITFV